MGRVRRNALPTGLRRRTLQPRLLPVEEATRLTPAVRGAVTSELREVDRVLHPPQRGPVDRVTSLVGAPVDPESFAAEAKHLGHERQRVEFAAFVQGGDDLLGRLDLDQLSYAQIQDSLHAVGSTLLQEAAGVASRCKKDMIWRRAWWTTPFARGGGARGS